MTPLRNCRRNQRQASTPRNHNHHDLSDLSRNRVEARPSPERLDAQIRQLVHAIESLKTQSRDQNNAIISKLDDLIKISSEKENPKPAAQKTTNKNLEEDLYGYGEEDFRDYSNIPMHMSLGPAGPRMPQNPQNIYGAPPPPRHPYSPLVYPPTAAAGLPNFYQGGLTGFNESGVQHLPQLYPSLYSMPSLYPRPTVDQPLNSMSQMTENIMQPGYFGQQGLNRLPAQMPDYSNIQTPPIYPPLQNADANKLRYFLLSICIIVYKYFF